MIPVVIPAKNEEEFLAKTVNSLRQTAEYAGEELYIVVVNDGSKDKTEQIAKELGCYVVNLPDRGYSALGKPELAQTHNAGYEYIDNHLDVNSYKYLMVVGADTYFAKDYLKLLIEAMERDDKLVMCAGVLNGIYTNYDAVRGSGRLIRNSFWSEVGRRSKDIHYGWESYPLFYARAKGYKTRTIKEAKMQTPREALARVDWWNYGAQMKESGSILPYVVLRGLKRAIKDGDVKGCVRLIWGYLTAKVTPYEKWIRDFNAKKQWRRLLTLGVKG